MKKLDNIKVVNLPGVSQAKEILELAIADDLSEVLIIGWMKNGQLYMNSSINSKTGEILHLLEASKFELLKDHSDS
jgi:hypothetical protein